MISTHIIKEEYSKKSVILHKFYNYLVITYLLENNKIKREKSNVEKAALKILPNYQDFIKKYKAKGQQWTQGVGHQTHLEEFDSLEAFARAWSDEEYRKFWTLGMRNCDNVTCRVLRTSMRIPPK